MSEEKQVVYTVLVPFAGAVAVEVKGPAGMEEEDVVNAAISNADIFGEQEIERLEYLTRIIQGNVCYAPVWDAEILSEEEEDNA